MVMILLETGCQLITEFVVSLFTMMATPSGSTPGDKLEERQTKKIKLPTKGITVGTWNVRTLYATGKLGELCHEMNRYSWNVLGISEVRWLNFGEATTDEGHKIWYSGERDKHELGVAIMVHKDTTNSVISWQPVSSRIITIRPSCMPHEKCHV